MNNGQCIKCNSTRIISINGKTVDCFGLGYKDISYWGYVPDKLNIGGGDYIEFKYCAECGQIQAKFPITDETIKEVTTEEEEE